MRAEKDAGAGGREDSWVGATQFESWSKRDVVAAIGFGSFRVDEGPGVGD